jgi:RNA polymerase sigma factor (sigma-70 family)
MTRAVGETGTVLRNRYGSVVQDLQTLFDSGTIGALTDAELLGRFADRRDESAGPAFTVLVERHGPMVLRVCRSVLRDDHDAQDAFQATFLILVRRAGAVRNRGSVGSWLYGVALRVSARARAAMARRRRHEARAAAMAADRSIEQRSPLELSAVLHEELGRLPERYRAAVVLCYLEGQTCEAAARQLGWPVGTVKSRLARGRERLLARLIRRGLGPDDALGGRVAQAVMSAALANNTAEAMLRFAAGRSTAGLVSETALSWALTTSRILQMTRLVLISALLIAGLATTGAALLATQEPKSVVPAKAAAEEGKPGMPSAPGKKVEPITVHVVDPAGHDMPNIEVEVIDRNSTAEGRRYRTGADGQFRVPVAPIGNRIEFQARPDDQTLGWASFHDQDLGPATDEHPVTLMLLPLNHRVEGSVVDSRGKPIPGVRIRPYQIEHEKTNGFRTVPPLSPSVTDEAGRFAITLPADTRVSLFSTYHPRYAGPWFHCGAEDRRIAPITLSDAGGIAGTVTDSATGKPVEGARVGASSIEHGLGVHVGGGGEFEATTDAQGHFQIGGQPPGVYNLHFEASPRGRRFTARAIEGVRVKAGEDARADLVMIEGRRLHGTAIHLYDNTPIAGTRVTCYSPSHLRSGPVSQFTFADEQGRFEFFVPPGPAVVSIPADQKTVTIPADRDPEPVRLENNPNAKPHPAARPIKVAECPVRIRVKVGEANAAAQDQVRTLSGRIFDPEGLPIAGVRVTYSGPLREKFSGVAATDRLGLFRLKGLPKDQFRLHIIKDDYGFGRATIPPEAREVDLTLPSQAVAPE